MEKETDSQVGSELTQHSRYELEVIVLDPYGCALCGSVGSCISDSAIDFDVAFPPIPVKESSFGRSESARPSRVEVSNVSAQGFWRRARRRIRSCSSVGEVPEWRLRWRRPLLQRCRRTSGQTSPVIELEGRTRCLTEGPRLDGGRACDSGASVARIRNRRRPPRNEVAEQRTLPALVWTPK